MEPLRMESLVYLEWRISVREAGDSGVSRSHLLFCGSACYYFGHNQEFLAAWPFNYRRSNAVTGFGVLQAESLTSGYLLM